MSTFRFLQLPYELRLKMYRYMLPYEQRLHLDPEKVHFPIPYIVPDSYGSTKDLILTCRKLHMEVMQFIYRHNTVNVIDVLEIPDCIPNLGKTALEYLSRLELHVREGLVDIGDIWETLENCSRLVDLRLVFYHERENWSKTLAEFAWYMQMADQVSKGSTFELDLELHRSIWAYPLQPKMLTKRFRKQMSRAKRMTKVYSYEIPPQIRHITITASVHDDAWEDFLFWVDDSGMREFRQLGKDYTDNKKTLRFLRIQPI